MINFILIRNLVTTFAMVIAAMATISLLANALEQRATVEGSASQAYAPPTRPYAPSPGK